MIDMHSHILPGADHGSESVEMSLSLIDAAISVGIDKIVATPHFYLSSGKSIDSFLQIRETAFSKLAAELGERADKVELYLGSEVNLRFGLSKQDGLERLCIGGSNIILLEMPLDKVWREWVFNEVSEIRDRLRLRPIIAHIDRYEPSQVEKLFDYFPLMAQINVSSVVPFLRRWRTMRYFDEGYVYALGSDAHRSSDVYDMYKKAVKLIGDGMDQIERRSHRILHEAEKAKLTL